MFSVEDRVAMLEATFADHPSVRVESYDGLTSAFCDEVGVQFQLRGVRNAVDLSYEQTLAQMTRANHPNLDTVVLLTDPEYTAIHSTWFATCCTMEATCPSLFLAIMPWLSQRG